MKRIVGVIVAVGLASCGGGGGGGGSSSKDLFSLWEEEDTGAHLDLRGGEFSAAIPISFFSQDGAQCNCDLMVIGVQSSGSYVINACVYKYGTGGGDPGCNALDQSGTYEKTSDVLTIRPSSGAPNVYR